MSVIDFIKENAELIASIVGGIIAIIAGGKYKYKSKEHKQSIKNITNSKAVIINGDINGDVDVKNGSISSKK